MVSLAKRLLIGRPIATSEEGHQRLRKRVALPIFASDAMSSTAYATDEILIVLLIQAGVGPLAFDWLVPLAIVVARPAPHRDPVVPADGLRLPLGRRRLRRVQGQPRRAALARCRSIAADRLHPHRRRVRRRRRPRHAVGVRLRQLAASPAVPRHHRGGHHRQPARAARVGSVVRPADVPVHHHARRADRGRAVPRVLPRPRADPTGRALRGGPRAGSGNSVAQPVHAAARLLVRRRGAVGSRGRLQRRADVPQAGEPQRVDDPGDDGARAGGRVPRRSPSSPRTSSRTGAISTPPGSP